MRKRALPGEALLLPKEREKRGEKVWVSELAAFLGCAPLLIHRIARPLNLISYRGGMQAGPQAYLTPRGAMRVMIAVRARQGAAAIEGKDYWAARLRTLARAQLRRGPRQPRQLRPLNPHPEPERPKPPPIHCSHGRKARLRGCKFTWFDPRNGKPYSAWEGNPLHVLPCAPWVVVSGPDGDTRDTSGVRGSRCVGLDYTGTGGTRRCVC